MLRSRCGGFEDFLDGNLQIVIDNLLEGLAILQDCCLRVFCAGRTTGHDDLLV